MLLQNFLKKIALTHFTYDLQTCSVNFEYNLSNGVTVDKKMMLHSTGTAMRKYKKISQNIPIFKRFFIVPSHVSVSDDEWFIYSVLYMDRLILPFLDFLRIT